MLVFLLPKKSFLAAAFPVKWYGMSIEQLASEALRLPPAQRALLAESLWESLEDPFKAPVEMDDAAALDLAMKRDRELESGEVRPTSHEQIMSRLRR